MVASVSRLHKTNKIAAADPQRLALEVALKEAGRVREAVDRQRAAIETTKAAVFAAAEAVEKAKAGVEKARKAHAVAIAEAARAGRQAGPSGVSAARQAIVDAEDAEQAQRSALAELQRDTEPLDVELTSAEATVDAAINAILAPYAEALVERGIRLAAELAPIRQALAAFIQEPVGQIGAFIPTGQRPVATAKDKAAAFLRSTHLVDRGSDPWQAARERLRADPYAALGELDALVAGD